jgi:thiosulfate dehydrogenase (quinone) large subunit
MTRKGMYLLTGIAAAMFLFLNWAFADDLFTGSFWDSKAIANSTIWTYVMLAAILVLGYWQAQRLTDEPKPLEIGATTGDGQIDDPRFWKLFLGNTWYSILWVPIRFFVGRDWLAAGEHKMRDDAWMNGGTALKGFWTNATTTPEGRPASPSGTYGWFEHLLKYMLTNEWYTWFAKVIAIGETLVGIGLILGALVGIAAFFGTLMNFNFELAGAASSNPVMFGLGVFLVLGWKTAGWLGLDRILLPLLGTPWTRIGNGNRAAKRAEPTTPELATTLRS